MKAIALRVGIGLALMAFAWGIKWTAHQFDVGWIKGAAWAIVAAFAVAVLWLIIRAIRVTLIMIEERRPGRQTGW